MRKTSITTTATSGRANKDSFTVQRSTRQGGCEFLALNSGSSSLKFGFYFPRKLQSEGIQRYGFHGLSCESIVQRLGSSLSNRLVIAHLGNGASATAVKNGKSIDTSMGLTPTGEVIMGTRSGDLDPGVLVYLMREKKFDAAMIEELVDHRSGLLGISGIAATCGGCMKPRRRTPSHDLPLRCSAIPCVSRWPR